MINIKRNIIDNKKVIFEYYRDSALWYKNEDGDLFPVPIEDIGNATFNQEDKAIFFMRYMRKFNESLELER